MITITTTMEIRPAKRREMMITLQELTDAMQNVPGFLNAHIGMNGKNDNELTFIEEWETQYDVNAYMQSNFFRVLKGALKVLTSSASIELSNGRKVYHRQPRTEGQYT